MTQQEDNTKNIEEALERVQRQALAMIADFRLIRQRDKGLNEELQGRVAELEQAHQQLLMYARDLRGEYERAKQEALLRQTYERFLSESLVNLIMADPKRVTLGGERRQATILFTDLRGFTALASQMAPEDTVLLLNSHFTRLAEIVFDYGGTLDKFMGDGIMAVFGAPFGYEDDALRGVRAALDMQGAMEPLNREWDLRFQTQIQMGIGLNSGVVLAGSVGAPKRLDYTVIGDSVNVAARLVALAGAGEIWSGPGTYEAVRSVVQAEALPPVRVKGKRGRVPVYILKSLSEGAVI